MKKVFKYFVGILLFLVVMMLLLPATLYIPAVQRYALDKGLAYVRESLRMEARVEHFDLTFPFDLRMESVYLGKPSGDTLVYTGNFRLNIGLLELLSGQVVATQLLLQEARVHWANDSTGMSIRVDVPELEIRSIRWRPGSKQTGVGNVSVTGGKVAFTGGTSSAPDTMDNTGLDWRFLVRRIQLREVDYRMHLQNLPFLQAGLGEGMIRNVALDLGKQQVQAREIELKKGGCTMELLSGTGTPVKSAPEQAEADSSGNWTVEAGRLDLEQFSFEMDGLSGGKIEIELAEIGLVLNGIYNRGTTVRAGLEELRLVRPQGGEISEIKAEADLDTTHTRLTGMLIRTPYSSLRLDATAETGITDLPGQAPIAVNLTGTVGAGDVRFFRPQLAVGWKSARVDADLSYHTDLLRVNQLDVSIPGCITLAANGQLSGYTRPEKLNGRMHVKAETGDSVCGRSLLGEAFTVPAGLLLTADLEASNGVTYPRITLCRKEGCADITGSYSFLSEQYDLHLKTDNFDLGAFFPDQPLGALTAELYLRGNQWRPGNAQAGLLLELEKGEYRQHTYRDIRLMAHLTDAHLEGVLQSRDSAALLDLRFDLISREGRYDGRVEGKAKLIDLQALHFTDTAMCVALNLHLEGETGRDTLWATALLDSVRLNEGGGFYELGRTELRLAGQPEQTAASLTSGDLNATFRADTAIPVLAKRIGSWTDLLQRQIMERSIDLQQLADTLPPFRFEWKSGSQNAPVIYLDTRRIWYRNLYAEISNERGKGLYARIGAEDPVLKNMEADTLAFALTQQGSEAEYSLQIYGLQGLPDSFYSLRISGRLLANGLEAAFRQQNRREETVVETGISVVMHDSSWQVSLFPENPVFGYNRWTLNKNNRIIFYPDHRILADLSLSSGEKQIRLRSQENTGGMPEKLQLQVQEIDLSALSAWLPLLPPWGGKINLDVSVNEEASALEGSGRIELGNFSYKQKRVGDIRMDLNYRGADRWSRHTAGVKLAIDGVQRLTVDGEAVTVPGDPSLRVDATIPALPLQAVSAFIPDGWMNLAGELRGDLKIRGTLKTPEIDGGFSFRNAWVTPAMPGTSFAVDSSRLSVRGGEVNFRKFSLLSANNQPMEINGTIDFTPFDRMKADLSVSARNFQAVNVRSNSGSPIFGKAYTDVNMTVKGAFTKLVMDGNVRVLNNTDVTYVMLNSTPELQDRSANLVRFLSFGDTLRQHRKVEQVQQNDGSFTLKLYVDIGEAVRANINLSEEGNDQIRIQGGGDLMFAASPEEGNTLSGRYGLNGGTVRYRVPIVGLKTFDIQSGSYIEWAGRLENPTLNISAGSSIRVNVVEENQSARMVNFTALIRIEGTLNRPQVTFDLNAPNDQDIRNQLATLSPEERTKQAMNLLVYGNYSGPGTMSTGNSANNTLNNFLAGELNQWSRRYLGDVGLTFGIDSYNRTGREGQQVTRTDYSYQFSKHLFNDRINVKIGGRISTDGEPGKGIEQNLVGDIAIEYALTRNRNWFLKAFRQTNYESVLEGEVTKTGAGVLLRKSFNRIKDLFIRKSKRKKSVSGDE